MPVKRKRKLVRSLKTPVSTRQAQLKVAEKIARDKKPEKDRQWLRRD